MRPHLLLTLVAGAAHRDVGSWIDLLADPNTGGPPFETSIDRLLLDRHVDASIVHEHTPAGSHGWSPDERTFGLDRVFRVILRSGDRFPDGLVDELRRLAVVERAEPGRVAAVGLPMASSMSRAPSGWAGEMISLEDAHAITAGDEAITVAVLDTGVWPSHPEYASQLRDGFDFVDIIDGASEFLGDRLDADSDPTDEYVGHGSHVTGIVAGQGLKMPVGVAPRCRIMPIRVLGSLRQGDHFIGAGLVDNISSGIKRAADAGADVINMSLGIEHSGGGLPHVDVVRYAISKGVSIVAAAGNDGTDTLYYPGALPSVLAIGAVDRDGEVAEYSTWGNQVDLVAPGTEIFSAWLRDGYGFATGTSQATPFVAGAIALCRSLARRRGRRLSPHQAAHVLQATADRLDQRFKHPRAGFGRLNVADALALTEHRLDQTARTRRREPAAA